MEIITGNNLKKTVIRHLLAFSLLFSAMFVLNATTLHAKEKPLSGQDKNGNEWVYDKKTKTLTFSGTVDLEYFEMDGHRPEPNWWCWQDEAEHLVIEYGITGLPGEEFSDFRRLKTVTLPDTVTCIGNCVFDGCWELETIIMSENLMVIGDFAFSDCYNWKNAYIPGKVTTIGEWAFCRCKNIKKIEIPDTVTKVGAFVFDGCENLRTARLPEKIQTIGEGLFRNCKSLSEVKLPSSVKKIESNAFSGSGITSIEIPENVTGFYKGECWYNEGIFEGCKKLKSITIKSKKLNHVYKGAFKGLKKDVVIKVPHSKLKKYKKMFQKAGLDKKVKIKSIGIKRKFDPAIPAPLMREGGELKIFIIKTCTFEFL